MKKAFAWLEGNRIEYALHDYKKSGIGAEKLKSWLRQVSWEQLVNTRGPTFRNLPANRQEGLNTAKAVALMTEFPSLIRRPVIEAGKELLIGFDPARYQALLSMQGSGSK
jgi:arsenate reductase